MSQSPLPIAGGIPARPSFASNASSALAGGAAGASTAAARGALQGEAFQKAMARAGETTHGPREPRRGRVRDPRAAGGKAEETSAQAAAREHETGAAATRPADGERADAAVGRARAHREKSAQTPKSGDAGSRASRAQEAESRGDAGDGERREPVAAAEATPAPAGETPRQVPGAEEDVALGADEADQSQIDAQDGDTIDVPSGLVAPAVAAVGGTPLTSSQALALLAGSCGRGNVGEAQGPGQATVEGVAGEGEGGMETGALPSASHASHVGDEGIAPAVQGDFAAGTTGESGVAPSGKNRAASATSAGIDLLLSAPGTAGLELPENFSLAPFPPEPRAGIDAAGAKGQGVESTAPEMSGSAGAQETGELDANVARVARGLRNALQQNGGAVTLRLDPPEMGVVRVMMEIRDGAASVTFRAERESAGALLSQHLDSLRQSLQRQGLSVENMDVQLMPRSEPLTPTQSSWAQTPDEGRSRGQFGSGRDGSQGGRREREGDAASAGDAAMFERALVNLIG